MAQAMVDEAGDTFLRTFRHFRTNWGDFSVVMDYYPELERSDAEQTGWANVFTGITFRHNDSNDPEDWQFSKKKGRAQALENMYFKGEYGCPDFGYEPGNMVNLTEALIFNLVEWVAEIKDLHLPTKNDEDPEKVRPFPEWFQYTVLELGKEVAARKAMEAVSDKLGFEVE